MSAETYRKLVDLLDRHAVPYRLIEHAAEGETAAVSRLRRHPLGQAAKCLVVRVRTSKRSRRYVLAVVPGDHLVDLDRLSAVIGGDRAAFASREVAEQLAGCASGSIIPFSFHPELELIVDAALLHHDELFFNAARLDRSIALRTADYLSVVGPQIAQIARAGSEPQDHHNFAA